MRRYGRADHVLRELGITRRPFPLMALCRRGAAEGRWLVGILLMLALFAAVFLLLLGAL